MKWWQRLGLIGLIGAVMLAGAGCAHTISEGIRRQADTTISFTQLRANPEAYKGRMVILGGQILQPQNVQEGTLLEVLQKPLDAYERPLLTDSTEGRFMVLCSTYLDPAVYAKGREVTVAGRVLGTRTGPVGEVQYTYPLIDCLELHLWPQLVQVTPQYAPYPPWYWDPWYWRPYRRPFWRPWYPYW
ncbi:MAG TPA: Slp family lipoprotein [Candidatus Tectomicrobia bacterium]|jgi:outer membrane lipoprotein